MTWLTTSQTSHWAKPFPLHPAPPAPPRTRAAAARRDRPLSLKAALYTIAFDTRITTRSGKGSRSQARGWSGGKKWGARSRTLLARWWLVEGEGASAAGAKKKLVMTEQSSGDIWYYLDLQVRYTPGPLVGLRLGALYCWFPFHRTSLRLLVRRLFARSSRGVHGRMD